MKKSFVRTLSIILTVLLITQIAPVGSVLTFAAPVAAPRITDIPSVPGEPSEPVLHVSEDVSLRTADTKHFLNQDNSYTAVQYPQNVHFPDANGDWQEIDNTLVDMGASYVPKANALNVSLPKRLGGGNRVTMFDVGVGLAISVPGASSEAVIVNTEDYLKDVANADPQLGGENNVAVDPVALANSEIETVHKQSSIAFYADAFPGADLEYNLHSDKLKENVIVREKQREYIYRFILDLNNLRAVPQKDGSIQLIDSKTTQPKFKIEAPYAVDANGVTADGVLTMSLEGNTLTLTADPKWMNANDRAYPVVLDPTYTHIFDATGMTEISVSSNWGKLSDIGFKLRVGAKKSLFMTNEYRSFLRFNLPALPGDAVVTNAVLSLDANNASLGTKILDWLAVLVKQVPDHEEKTKEKVNISAHEITGPWGELNGWLTQPGHDETALSLGEMHNNTLGAAGDGYNFDITTAVKKWISGETANYGVMLKAVDNKKTDNNYLEFASLRAFFPIPLPMPGIVSETDLNEHDILINFGYLTETDTEGNRQYVLDAHGNRQCIVITYDLNLPIIINAFDAEPCLQIQYVSNTGLENYWSYQQVPMGRAGAAYVNQYSGGLTYVHPDAVLTGERMPVSLAHTYVSNHMKNNGSNWNMKLGVGFRLSLFEEILPINCYESQGGTVVETDGFWNELWIGIKETAENFYYAFKGVFTDQNFPDSWLELSSQIKPSDYYTLIDGDGTEHRFIKKGSGRFESEINPALYLELDSSQNLVMKDEYGNQKIYSPLRTEHSGIREYVYRYLTKVKDTNGNETNIVYDGNGKIDRIVDTIGRVIKLNYDGNYLKSITDPIGRSTTFAYDTGKDLLTSITYFDTEKTEFTYSEFSDRNEKAWHRRQIAIVTAPNDHQYAFTYYKVDTADSSGYRVREVLHGMGGTITSYDPSEGVTPASQRKAWWEGSPIASGIINFISPIWDWIASNIILPILRLFNPRWTYQLDTKWFELAPKTYGDDDPITLDYTDGIDIETTAFLYGSNQTTITNSLQKEAVVTLTFDRLGRAVGAKEESSGNSAFIGYTDDEGVQNLPGYSAGAADVDNLLQNPGFESGGKWSGGGSATGDAFAGNSAWQLSSGATIQQATDSKASIIANETYTVSLYAKASASGAKAELTFTQRSNISNALPDEKATLELTDKWERYTATFKTDSANPVHIAVKAVNSTVLLDAVQVERNGGASPYNFVENSHFRFDANWASSGTVLDNRKDGYQKNDLNDARFYNLSGNVEKKSLVQSIPLNGKKGDTIVFGATAKIIATSEECYVLAEFFENGTPIAVQSSSSEKEKDEKDRKASFNRDVIAEQGTATSYVLPDDCTEMRLSIHNENQVNDMEVYSAFVFKGVGGTKYAYENGKVKQATSPAGTATYTYNNNDLTKIEVRKPGKTEPDESVEYTYDGKHNVTLATEAKKDTDTGTAWLVAQTQYNYNNSLVPNVTGILVGSTAVSYAATKNSLGKYVPTSQILADTQTITYRDTATCNEAEKVEDGNGNWVKYTYKTHPNGFLDNSLVDNSAASDGSVYSYVYDGRDMLTDILSDIYQNTYGYTTKSTEGVSDALKSIAHNGTTYSFAYNALGQVLNTKIGNQEIVKNSYYDADDERIDAMYHRFALGKTEYANGWFYEPRYDEKRQVIGDVYYSQDDLSPSVAYGYTYSKEGALSKVLNNETKQETQLGYDMTGRLTDVYTKSTETENISTRTRLSYNDEGAFVGLQVLQNDITLSQASYGYDGFYRPKKVLLPTLGTELTYGYDPATNRLDNTRLGSAVTSYGYSDVATTVVVNNETLSAKIPKYITQMSTVLPGNSFTYDYTYVAPNTYGALVAEYGSGNIKSVTGPDGTHTYTYDKIGQLTKDVAPGGTYNYAYDQGGNLLSISGAANHTFTYGNANWKDQLTAFDGNTLTYDELGNLKTYDNHLYEWQKASQLKKISGPTINAVYTYDYTGLRSSKNTGGVTTDFIWAGGLLVAQKSSDGNAIAWSYDGGGSMIGFSHNGDSYFYIRNLQGDVVGIYDAAGAVVATYEYDAWGNQLTAQALGSVGDLNPIRYRGYYYDTETGFYYCQSRYYNPQWYRWISGDTFCDTGTSMLGTNMYAYCDNDPANKYDPAGTDAIYAVLYSNGGMKVVGHSLLLMQDADGIWWATEYIGRSGDTIIEQKKNARVYTWETVKGDETWQRIQNPRKGLKSGASTALIKGDFTKSLKLAKIYNQLDDDRKKNGYSLEDSRFGNSTGYNLIFNNCLHYVLIIMNEAWALPKPVADVIGRALIPLTTIPSVFYAELLAALRLSGEKKPK